MRATLTEYNGPLHEDLIVIKRIAKEEAPWKTHETAWLVECKKCHRQWITRKSALTAGCTMCNHPNGGGRGNINKNIIGQKFGYLTVLDYIHGSGTNNHPYVKCQCECGNIVDVRLDHLKGRMKDGRFQKTISCGCAHKSVGELTIENILQTHNINYQIQYKIPNFSEYSLFDFAIFDSDNQLLYLLEYDGEQHFKVVSLFGEEKFKIQQENDRRKNEYCLNNNIKLIRIPYTDLQNITWEYLIEKMPEIVHAEIKIL